MSIGCVIKGLRYREYSGALKCLAYEQMRLVKLAGYTHVKNQYRQQEATRARSWLTPRTLRAILTYRACRSSDLTGWRYREYSGAHVPLNALPMNKCAS